MEEKTCRKCGQSRSRPEWTDSTWSVPSQWCRPCLRDWHRSRYQTQGGVDDAERPCTFCGRVYRPKNRRVSVYCSRDCKDKAHEGARKAARLATKTSRECLHCGEALAAATRADAVFCSVKCNNAAHCLQRKLRTRTGGSGLTGWVRTAIFERDGWRCGICRKPVSRALRHPDPMAPSLDHIIPVCEGGTNETANLRLTHLRCNLSRRNRGGNEQLALT